MKEIITLLVLAALLGLLSYVLRNAEKRNQNMKSTYAVIERVSHVDSEINYYFRINDDGQTVEGKSITYPPSTKRLCVGDCVAIDYYFTKAGWARVIIKDDELSPCENTLTKVPRILLGISLCLTAIAAFLALKMVL